MYTLINYYYILFRYRRRKKDDEIGPEIITGTTPQQPTGSQSFELAAAGAFPPLPHQVVSIPHQSPTSLPPDQLSPRNHYDPRYVVLHIIYNLMH